MARSNYRPQAPKPRNKVRRPNQGAIQRGERYIRSVKYRHDLFG